MADPSAAAVAHHGHPDVTKRDFLKLVTGASAAIGTAAAAWTFIDYMNPSRDVLALSSVEVELTPIVAGQGITVLCPPPHGQGDQGGGGRQAVRTHRATGGFGPGEAGP